MLICRALASLTSCSSWINTNPSPSSRRMVDFGGTLSCTSSSCCGFVRVGVAKSLINSRGSISRSRSGVGCGFWGVAVDSRDGMMMAARRSGATRRSSCFVVRAQRTRFSQKYSRAQQDKIEKSVKALCASDEVGTETLQKLGSWMTPANWLSVLDGIGRRRRWLLALEVFRWIQVQKWYKADSGYYSKLISIMGKERRYRLALIMFKEMKKIGCRPDTSLNNSVMTIYLLSEDKKEGFAKAISLLDEMKLIRICQPSIVTYNILVRAAAQMGDQETVNSLLKDLYNRDLSADNYTYNGVMDAYGKAGEINMMEAMFKRMRDEKLKPDVITFNILIDAYGKAGQFEKMEQVLWSMTLKRTPPILPTSKTLNSIITNYGNAGLVEKFESVLMEMEKLNVSQTFLTYEALVEAYGKCGLFEKMRDRLKRMQSVGYKPKLSTVIKMLDSYCSRGMTTEAEDLLKNCKQEFGVEATPLLYAMVIRAHKKAGIWARVQDLLDKMTIAGLRPTKETYLEVMEMIGIEAHYQKSQNDDTAGTVRDFDESYSVTNERAANQEFVQIM